MTLSLVRCSIILITFNDKGTLRMTLSLVRCSVILITLNDKGTPLSLKVINIIEHLTKDRVIRLVPLLLRVINITEHLTKDRVIRNQTYDPILGKMFYYINNL
jgi:hypothetical protein